MQIANGGRDGAARGDASASSHPSPTLLDPDHPPEVALVNRPEHADPLERSLQQIWERTLGVSPIGLDDDFFALGGHSLKALRLLAEIERRHGVPLRAPALFEAPTVRALAKKLRASTVNDKSTVAPIQRAGTRPPLFIAPGGGGELFILDALARALGPEQPLYLLDVYAVGELPVPGAGFTMQGIAARILEDMRRVQLRGPYQLAGYSLGGKIVFEMAQQLREAGESVQLVALLDSNGPEYPRLEPFLVRAAAHIQHALGLERRDALKYVLDRIGRLSRYVFGPEPLRAQLYADQPELRLVPEIVIQRMERALLPVLAAWEQYVPEPYEGDVLLVRAETRTPMIGVRDDDPQLGWGPVVRGRLRVENMACDHFTLLRPENAAQLARILSRYLLPACPAGVGARAG